MDAVGGILAPLARRLLRTAFDRTAAVTRKLGSIQRPLHQSAFSHHLGRRSPATASHRVTISGGSTKHGIRSALRDYSNRPVSQRTFTRAVRPTISGGAAFRVAREYGLGHGCARYFSHTSVCSAVVVNNVSQATRAFFLSGKRAQYDGLDAKGRNKYRVVSVLEEDAARKIASAPKFAPGAYVDFRLTPVITALGPLSSPFPFPPVTSASRTERMAINPTPSLNAEGFLDFLKGDLIRAANDLTAVLSDLERLAFLGDLPLTIENGNILRVRFPGLDADSVVRLCQEVGVLRGLVGEDAEFDDMTGTLMALKFPFAPDRPVKAPSPPGASLWSSVGSWASEDIVDDAFLDEVAQNPWLSMEGSEAHGYHGHAPRIQGASHSSPEDFEGIKGIYRFIQECDRAHGQYRN